MTATELFERYHVIAFRYFLRATGSHDAADDLTQDLFLRVVRNLGACPPGRELGWVFRIARNLMIDDRRTHMVRQHVPLADARGLGVNATQLVAFGVSEALTFLAAGERDAFLLREMVGLSYAEIAATCDTKPETVRSRLYQARCRLKSLLGARLSTDRNKQRNQDG